MDIESARLALSALIAALPTVMSLGLVAILAYPDTKLRYKKNRNIYWKFLIGLVFILILFTSSIILDMIVLIGIDIIFLTKDFLIFWISIALSITSLQAMPLFILIYLSSTKNLE